MTEFESLSNVGHRMMLPAATVLTTFVRPLNWFIPSLKVKKDSPCRQDAPPEVSPSTNTSFVASGEKLGTIIAVVPSPQLLGPVTSTGIGGGGALARGDRLRGDRLRME